jgi:hypothetical protein
MQIFMMSFESGGNFSSHHLPASRGVLEARAFSEAKAFPKPEPFRSQGLFEEGLSEEGLSEEGLSEAKGDHG